MNIFEGGNVFKDADGHALTQRINQADVKPTLAWLEELVPGLDLLNNTLGSTGIKDTSGDLDIAVDTKTPTIARSFHQKKNQQPHKKSVVRVAKFHEHLLQNHPTTSDAHRQWINEAIDHARVNPC